MKVGIKVECKVCGHMKKPRGRSGPLGAYYCEPIFGDLPGGCEGYDQEPHVGSLWPGESEVQFGYGVGPEGTEERENCFACGGLAEAGYTLYEGLRDKDPCPRCEGRGWESEA